MITYKVLGTNGRLANQLFAISTTIATALRNNDTYIFPQWVNEPYFNLHGCFSDNIGPMPNYTEPHFHYAPIPYSSNLNLVGYFQSFLYFQDYESEIIRLLMPNHHADKEPGLCSIHVRRGDYLKFQDCHPIQPMNYYEKAMETSKCSKFLVFSDDIAWCKDNFKGNQFEFSEGNAPHIDLALMAKKCEHNIICNSSFSWWGAWLNKSPNKIVIVPDKWFGPKLQHDTKDLCQPDWIKI